MPNHLPMNGTVPQGRTLTLASGSPRRRRLIEAIDMPIRIVGSGNDEPLPYSVESPQAYVQRLALIKARHGLAQAQAELALGADTSVVIDRYILGKPTDAAEATRMLRRLRGRSHSVVTGIALADAATGVELTLAKVSRVHMREYTDEEIAAYVESGEPFDKAGAYAVQDRRFKPASRIYGCYRNTVGLPLCDVLTLLERIGTPATFKQGWTAPRGCPDCDRWHSITSREAEVNRL